MYSHLLKKALPFALTFVVGAGLGGLFKSHRSYEAAWSVNVTPLMGHEGPFGDHHGCRMRRRALVAETKPLVILFKPDAPLPRGSEGYQNSMWVRVTFGSDGKARDVEQLQPLLPEAMQKAAERAALQIQFEPATVNSVPISIEKDVEIHFMGD
jgi:hypothetical protein